ncbi:MAG: hypothetical protein E7Z64_05255 [Thermoplasmata archaeon]|nr:hypothetical protein [Thermoplasmata archaeon]
MDPVYQESRMVLPKNLAILLAAVLAATWLFMIVNKLVFYDGMPVLAIILFGAAFAVLGAMCFLMKSSITVYEDRVVLKHILHSHEIPMEQIIDTKVGDLDVIKNYSDWTLKGVKYRTFAVIGEDRGIGLKVTGKRVFYLSSQDPEGIAALLSKDDRKGA